MAQNELYGNWLSPSPGKRVVRQPEIYSSGISAHESHLQSDSADSFTDEDYDDVIILEMEDRLQQRMPAYEGNADVPIPSSKGNTGVYFLSGKSAPSSLPRKEDYILGGNPAPSSLPRKAAPLPDASQGTGYRKKSVVMPYVLLGICFVMWAILLSLAVAKYAEISEELKSLNNTRVERLMNELTMSTDFNSLNSQLLNESKELAGLRLRIQETQVDHRNDTSDRQDFTEIRSLTHALWKELAEMRQNHCRLEETLITVQEELQSITEFICTKCPSGWKQFEKKCYYFSTSSTSWAEAKQFCANESSQLVIINSEQEHAFLSNYLIKPREYWLGLNDSEEEGQWRWLDGSPLSVKFWAEGEPNNAGTQGEDCGILGAGRTWNDVRCSMSGYWICERQC